ncbi:aldehyde dehydrogenase family protein [Streptomyces sp. NPDC050560]|uniref:aldehyde dehydrogenase family protein n=1 Tax=Streptomyces sp. NPDC050560 TaxID=3365630 RepID=UPI0037BB4C8C
MAENPTVPPRGMLIDGELVPASDGAVLPAENPTTEETAGELPDATPEDVDRAVKAARRAGPAWAATPWAERAKVLHAYAAVLEDNLEELARLDAIDGGLPLTSMRADVRGAAGEIRYFAGIAGETKGRTIPSGPDALTYTEFVPYPVVARIVPFNHPVKFIAAKVSAALAAGAPVVAKPGEQTSLSALRLAELVRDVFPAGVLNIVTGSGARAGHALSSHPDVPRVAFTGSVPTGARIMAAGAPTIKHHSLELGGKNPLIVFPDADPVRAARASVAAMNLARSMGQSCGSSSRVFVHRDVKEEFLAALVTRVGELRVGDPLDERTDMGPIAFRAHYEKVTGYIETGRKEGADLLFGGGRPTGLDKGFFVEPTVFADVSMDMTIAREEIFGPVMSILDWDDYETMIDEVNMLPFGLTGNVWTKDISLALRTARRIESGYISVNSAGKRPTGSPFGGFKSSGIGKESGLDELLSYGREQSVTVTLD